MLQVLSDAEEQHFCIKRKSCEPVFMHIHSHIYICHTSGPRKVLFMIQVFSELPLGISKRFCKIGRNLKFKLNSISEHIFLVERTRSNKTCQSVSAAMNMSCFVFINDLKFFEEKQLLRGKYQTFNLSDLQYTMSSP